MYHFIFYIGKNMLTLQIFRDLLDKGAFFRCKLNLCNTNIMICFILFTYIYVLLVFAIKIIFIFYHAMFPVMGVISKEQNWSSSIWRFVNLLFRPKSLSTKFSSSKNYVRGSDFDDWKKVLFIFWSISLVTTYSTFVCILHILRVLKLELEYNCSEIIQLPLFPFRSLYTGLRGMSERGMEEW